MLRFYVRMTKRFFPIATLTSIFLLAPFAHADLPQMAEHPWLGYFIGIQNRKSQFGITGKGDGIMHPLKRDGTPQATTNPIKVHYEILETSPEGKVVSKQVRADTLQTNHEATDDPKEPVKFTGKVTGDAAFAVVVTPERGGYSITGTITDKGTLTGSLQFVITIDWNPYKAGITGDGEEALEKFEKKVKRDALRLVTVSGEREKIEFLDKVNPSKLYPDGFTKAELRTEGYTEVTYEMEAVGKSKITFEDKGEKEFWNGFSTRWSVDEGGDPAQAKLIITEK